MPDPSRPSHEPTAHLRVFAQVGSVQLVYRPALLAQTDGGGQVLCDLEERHIATRLLPWTTIDTTHLFAASDEELQSLAALRHLPRDARTMAEIGKWLTSRGHEGVPLVRLLIQGSIGPDFRLVPHLVRPPALPKRLPVMPIPQSSGSLCPVTKEDLNSAIEALRRLAGLLWGIRLGAYRFVGFPVYRASAGGDNALHVPAATAWPRRFSITAGIMRGAMP